MLLLLLMLLLHQHGLLAHQLRLDVRLSCDGALLPESVHLLLVHDSSEAHRELGELCVEEALGVT